MNLRSFSVPLFSSSEKPPRYERNGEGRRLLSWSFLGLSLGVVFGLLLTSQTRRIFLSEVATLLPPRNPITRFVDSGITLREVPDAMEQFANARQLPTGRYDTAKNAPLFPQEIELMRIAALYPNRADVQANFLSAMTEFRVRLDSAQLKALEKPQVSVTPLPLPPTLREAIRNSIKNGERSEPRNGFFPLVSAFVEITQNRDVEGFSAIHRAALCSEWNSHTGEQSQGELEAIQRRHGMVSPHEVLTHGANRYYSGFYFSSTVARIIRTHAGRYEAAGQIKEGFALRMNLVTMGLKMANPKSESALSSSPRIFLIMALTTPAGKEWVAKKNSPTYLRKSDTHSGIKEYHDFLKAKGFSQESQIVKQLFQHPLLPSDYSQVGQDLDGLYNNIDIAVLQGAGMLTLAGICVALGFFGCASLFLHRGRFGDYRLPRLTPSLSRGIALGVLLITLSLMGIYFSEVPVVMALLIGALTGFLLLLPHLTRSNPEMAQMFRVAGKLMATCTGIFVFCIGICVSVSLWTDYAPNSVNSELLETSQNVTVIASRIVPLPEIAVMTGCVLGLSALLFLVCSIYAKTKRQPMASGGLLHFQAMGVPVIALALLGYAASVIYTTERFKQSETVIQNALSQRG